MKSQKGISEHFLPWTEPSAEGVFWHPSSLSIQGKRTNQWWYLFSPAVGILLKIYFTECVWFSLKFPPSKRDHCAIMQSERELPLFKGRDLRETPIRGWGSSSPKRQQPKDFIWPKKNIGYRGDHAWFIQGHDPRCHWESQLKSWYVGVC